MNYNYLISKFNELKKAQLETETGLPIEFRERTNLHSIFQLDSNSF